MISLDIQLLFFFKLEKVYVNPDEIKPRCIRCNSRDFIYIPAVCLRYLQIVYAQKKGIEIGVQEDTLSKLKEKMTKLNPKADRKNYCFISNGTHGLIAMTPKALIYLE